MNAHCSPKDTLRRITNWRPRKMTTTEISLCKLAIALLLVEFGLMLL